MNWNVILFRQAKWAGLTLICALCSPMAVTANDLQKAQKRELEQASKRLIAEGKQLEKSGMLVEARLKYAESLGYIELKDAQKEVERIDRQLAGNAKGAIAAAHKMYEAGRYHDAQQMLEDALYLQTWRPLIYYNLALCHQQLGDRSKAIEDLDQALAGAPNPKLRARLAQMRTALTTDEKPTALVDNGKKEVEEFDHLAEKVGNGSILEDQLGDEEDDSANADNEDSSDVAEAGHETSGPHTTSPTQPAATPAARGTVKAFTATDATAHGKGTRFSSACGALEGFKGPAASSAAVTFNLASCAESNNRPDEAARLLRHYLELAPKALDAQQVNSRISELEQLKALPSQNGSEIRRLYASASRGIEERQYDRVLMDFTKAENLEPNFALTHWKLGLLHEAMGNVRVAKQEFGRYQELESNASERQRADFHLQTLDAKRQKYDEEVSEAEDTIADLFNRAMNLTFNNGLQDRSALRVQRTHYKGHENKNAKKLAGFAVPIPYAQEQLSSAGQHLLGALSIFPLGAEANELMALIYLQALDGRAALRSLDAVASQDLPVSFYAEIRAHNFDRPAKCELSRDHLRFIFLASTYDKKGFPAPPKRQAGQDGLGDLVIEPAVPRALNFDDYAFRLSDVKKVETKGIQVSFHLQNEDFTLSPLLVANIAPLDGPAARRFSNDYTRLFVRYLGLEDSKLGNEGLTGGEKFKLGMKLANSAMTDRKSVV